jgi:hypothetical protein
MENKIDLSVTNKYSISFQTIAEVLDVAFYGGSNYWYWINEIDDSKVKIKFIPTFFDSTSIATRVLNGAVISIWDIDTDEELGTLTLDSIKKGLKLMGKQYPKHFINIVTENYDADDADIFLQLAVMGSVVYG